MNLSDCATRLAHTGGDRTLPLAKRARPTAVLFPPSPDPPLQFLGLGRLPGLLLASGSDPLPSAGLDCPNGTANDILRFKTPANLRI